MVYKSSSPTKDGRCWQFRVWYTDPYGERKQFNSKKYLTKKEAQKEEALFSNTTQVVLSDSTTLSEIMELFVKSKENIARNNTKKSYKQSINIWSKFGKVRLCDFTTNTYELFLKQHEKLKPRTINVHIIFLRTALKYFAKVYDVSVHRQLNILQKVNEEEAVKLRYYSYQEYMTLKDFSNRPELITTLYYMGLRIGEARGLTWRDVDFENNRISIYRQIEGNHDNAVFKPLKTKNSVRVLPMPPQVKQALEVLKMACETYSNYNDDWFVFNKAIPFVDQSARTNFRQACKKANVECLGFHAFRQSKGMKP